MQIINIVDSLSARNFGIWNAAMNIAGEVQEEKHSISLWSFSRPDADNDLLRHALVLEGSSRDYVKNLIKTHGLNVTSDVIVTHGCWGKPTTIGYNFARNGFTWVYVPHGMLEPWSMKQKAIKKIVYLHLFEKRMVARSSAIRAVSQSEADNLSELFPQKKIFVIGNGLNIKTLSVPNKIIPRQYLFLGRLHHKKGVLELIEGWLQSNLNNTKNYKLVIAGPDEGELSRILPLISQSSNIHYIGAVYDDAKTKVLSESSFFILPSYSEGFPTSILEAMFFRALCLISENCNFPEAFQNELALEVNPSAGSIASQLEYSKDMPSEKIEKITLKAKNFVIENYSLKSIANRQINLYKPLLAPSNPA